MIKIYEIYLKNLRPCAVARLTRLNERSVTLYNIILIVHLYKINILKSKVALLFLLLHKTWLTLDTSPACQKSLYLMSSYPHAMCTIHSFLLYLPSPIPNHITFSFISLIVVVGSHSHLVLIPAYLGWMRPNFVHVQMVYWMRVWETLLSHLYLKICAWKYSFCIEKSRNLKYFFKYNLQMKVVSGFVYVILILMDKFIISCVKISRNVYFYLKE